MDIGKAKLIVDLTLAKVEILKLKADDHNWSCYVDEQTKIQIEEALASINEQLQQLKS